MKVFDDYGLKLCQYQGELFVLSKEKTECSSLVFIRRFMQSKLAYRMDAVGFLFEALSLPEAIHEINSEYGVSNYGQIKYSKEELYWIGYIYRYWCYTYEISSKKLYKKIKPEILKQLYYPYHSLDPAQAIERANEAVQRCDDNYIDRGVQLMRKVKSSQQETVALKNIIQNRVEQD